MQPAWAMMTMAVSGLTTSSFLSGSSTMADHVRQLTVAHINIQKFISLQNPRKQAATRLLQTHSTIYNQGAYAEDG